MFSVSDRDLAKAKEIANSSQEASYIIEATSKSTGNRQKFVTNSKFVKSKDFADQKGAVLAGVTPDPK